MIGRFFLIQSESHGGKYFEETPYLPGPPGFTRQDAMVQLAGIHDPLAIWECIPTEGYMHDISEEMARMWFDTLKWRMPQADLPPFVVEHMPSDEIVDYYDAQEGLGIK
jgi:hypothetical protein